MSYGFRGLVALCLASLGVATLSCDGGADDEAGASAQSALCRTVVDKLQECGLVTRGYFRCFEPRNEGQECALSCLHDGCEDARTALCLGSAARHQGISGPVLMASELQLS